MSRAEIQEMKKQLHEKIDAIDDETALQMLNEAVTDYTSVGQGDILDELSPEQLAELDEAIAETERGDVISHEEFKRQTREWLSE